MTRDLKLVGHILLVLFAPQLVLAQWSEGHDGQLVIHGGWLFDGVSEERRPMRIQHQNRGGRLRWLALRYYGIRNTAGSACPR